MKADNHRPTDRFHPMDALMRLLKAEMLKEMFIKSIDGLMKDKNHMKLITGLILVTTFINAIVGLMMFKLLTKQSKLPNAMEALSQSTLLRMYMELLGELTLFLLDNLEIVEIIDKMKLKQLVLFLFPPKLPKLEFFQQPISFELKETLGQTADALYYYPFRIIAYKT